MKIAIFDGILETHLGTSLERSLVSQGHTVLNTGKIGSGFMFPSDPILLASLNRHIDEVLDFDPDVVFVFRPASLPFPLLRRIKTKGAQLVAWFSDDPVLWKLSYGPVVDHYDVILHCGTPAVLEYYEQMHGYPTGVNFPFWTDSQTFPKVYGLHQPESDVMFLGNVHDAVRRQRYFGLGAMNQNLRIHGNVGADYYNIWGGYLDSDLEVLDAGSRTRLAVNIPQYFKDHRGLGTWFDGLDELGFFQFPSRVIQYAAMGIPIISVVPDASDMATFPEIVCVTGIRDLEQRITQLLESNELKDLSELTHQRFQRHFSADSRVMALEAVLEDDSWRYLSSRDRAAWFTQFDGTSVPNRLPPTPSLDSPLFISEADSRRDVDVMVRDHLGTIPTVLSSQTIILVGVGWANEASAIRTAQRALSNLGHRVVAANPYSAKHFFASDPFGHFAGTFDVRAFYDEKAPDAQVVMFVGKEYIPQGQGATTLSNLGVKFVNHANDSNQVGLKETRLASLMDLTTVVNSSVATHYYSAGYENTVHVPDLVDRDFVRVLSLLSTQQVQLGVVAEREAHIGANRKVINEFKSLPTRQFVADLNGKERHALANIARTVKSAATIVLPDTGRKGPLPNRLLGHAMFGGGIPIILRGNAPTVITSPGENCLAIEHPNEIDKKLRRLLSNTRMAQSLRVNAVKCAISQFSAEERLQAAIDQLYAGEYLGQGAKAHIELSGVGTVIDCADESEGYFRVRIAHDPTSATHEYTITVDNHPIYEHAGHWPYENEVLIALPVHEYEELTFQAAHRSGVTAASLEHLNENSADAIGLSGQPRLYSRSPFGQSKTGVFYA